MTKAKLIELVRKAVGSPDGLVDRTIALHIENAFIQVSREIFGKNLHKLDRYAKPYTVSITKDPDTGQYYSILPVPVMQTIDVGDGVRRIRKLKGPDSVEFVPLRGIDPALLSNLEVGQIDSSIGYIIKKDRVEYYNHLNDITQVRMDLVTTFSNYDDDDDFPLPMGASDQIIALAVASYNGKLEMSNG